MSGVTSFQLESPEPVSPPESLEDSSLLPLIEQMIDAPLHLHVDDDASGPSICYIEKAHTDLLKKFYDRSVRSIGTADTVHIYRDVLTRMATQYSFALHAVLTFTLMHDRILYDPVGTKPSTAETFHSYHAAAMFNKKLSEPLKEEEKDAMWGVAALLGSSAYAACEATCAEEAWPLKEHEISDLDWLKMSDGKKAVWKLADPMRESSVFRPAIVKQNAMKQSEAPRALTNPVLVQSFPYLTQVYRLHSPRSIYDDMHPYFNAASIVERLVPLDCTYRTVMWFLAFIGHMDPEYRRLLGQKDPYAMVLLAWWYAKVLSYNSWWMTRRALFESQAICIYLEKTLPAEHELRKLLDFPKSACGLGGPAWRDCPGHNDTTTLQWCCEKTLETSK